MIYLNRVEVIGNLTRDPELRFTPNQQQVAGFAVATNRRYRDQSGNWIDAPAEYHEIVVWGQLGERCSQVLHKGDRVYVSGRLQTRSWETPDGNKRYRTEMIADSVIGPDQVNKGMSSSFDSPASNSPTEEVAIDSPAEKSSGRKGKTATSPTAPAASAADEEINIEDIPF